MNTPPNSSLGREVAYPTQYDPSLLFPIPRLPSREAVGIDPAALPFVGQDRWHAYELGWLDAHGKPCVATATLQVPHDSANLIESKSLKLYLNSLSSTRFNSAEAVRESIATDLPARAGAPAHGRVRPASGRRRRAPGAGAVSIDGLDVSIDDYGPPNASRLRRRLPAKGGGGNPGLGAAEIQLPGYRSTGLGQHQRALSRRADEDREGLRRYLVSYRNHAEFHEQCVERIFHDLMHRCAPQWLVVEARCTRRGGLDIKLRRTSPQKCRYQ